MAIVAFELEDLKRLGLGESETKKAITTLGMSLESTEDGTITIDVTPNRPDMLDIVGFSRAVLLVTGKRVPKEKFYSIKNPPITRISVTGAVKRTRPFISAAVVKNVNLEGNNLKNLINFTEKFCETYGRKRKKIAIGIYDYDKIDGELTYDASHEGEFVPLGSNTKSKFSEVLKGHEKGVEYSGILGKGKRKLYPHLKDSKGVLSLIPIVNSEEYRVTNSTKNILVEMTGTSRNAIDKALQLIACSFMDAEAEIYPCEIVYPSKARVTPELEYERIRIRKSVIDKTLGISIEEGRIITYANRLGHVAAKYGKNTLVYVPPYRIDVMNYQDIMEDIAIAYGYNKIIPLPVMGVSNGLAEESKEQANRISRLMIGMGFSEAMNFYLTNENTSYASMNHEADEHSTIKVGYAKTESITMLRTSILPLLMQNLGNSMHESMPQRIFEIGKVFRMENGVVIDDTHIGIASEHSRANYSEVKAIVIELLGFLGLKDYDISELDDGAFIKGRCAEVIVGKEQIGYFGEISPKVLNNFRLEEPVVAAEINITRVKSTQD